ncbi:GAF domain-containing protein [Blastococcus montanus]|uniref:GAF domain-containing protein n=1 Tax=Blastococcus montanus TaxID=3144973 RepID=UPI003209C7D2
MRSAPRSGDRHEHRRVPRRGAAPGGPAPVAGAGGRQRRRQPVAGARSRPLRCLHPPPRHPGPPGAQRPVPRRRGARGMGPELRAVLRDRGRPWGAVILFRETGSRDFTEAEVELVAALAPDVAAAVRRTLLVSEVAHRDAEEGPGMAVLRVDGPRIDVELASRAARVLMDQMPDSRIDGVPVGVHVLVSGSSRREDAVSRRPCGCGRAGG